MFTTGIIAFREFLEAFLIVGVFLGISKKLKLGKEIEIVFAAAIGFLASLLLATLTYIFGDYARYTLTHDNAELLESYLLIFSGCFIAYVVFSLHTVLRRSRAGKVIEAHKKLQGNAFDFSLLFTIAVLVVREGFEIALFTASTSLFSVFLQNFLGLVIGFFAASILGILTFVSYVRFPISRVFRATEYMIILLGASLVQNGVTNLLEHQFNVSLSDVVRLPLAFLPSENTMIGHFLQSFFGIDNQFSLARLGIMIVYVASVYVLFLRRQNSATLTSG